MSIADNFCRVHERIALAAERAGRRADEVELVGVTKYVGAAEAAELARAGCTDLGESRPQELWQKFGEVASAAGHPAPPIRWHLVGHLQRNKVRRTLPLVHMIHSIDSERLLAAINEEAGRISALAGTGGDSGTPSQSGPIKVLLEVNTSGEPAKHGLAPEAVEPLLAAAASFDRVEVCGLMTMAALEGGPAAAARNFATLRDLRDTLRSKAPPNVRLEELSMGMSGDFEIAIAEGASIVRVGTLLWE
jgi:pyridoxal phosphate enzyme (YggS family)